MVVAEDYALGMGQKIRLQDETEYDEVQTIARCLTIHRVHYDEDDKGKLYGVNDFSSPHFQNAPTTLIVVDEASMVNEMEAAALLELFHNCHIVFVGDVNQLPPIEPGPFFHELIESGVIPVMELTENHRVDVPELGENADKILDGNTKLHLTNHFMMIPGDDESVVQTIVTEYQNYLHNGADFADILLMSAVNKGIGSVADLNARLQDLMNPAVSQVRKFMDTVRMREYIESGDDRIGFFGFNAFGGVKLCCALEALGLLSKYAGSNILVCDKSVLLNSFYPSPTMIDLNLPAMAARARQRAVSFIFFIVQVSFFPKNPSD